MTFIFENDQAIQKVNKYAKSKDATASHLKVITLKGTHTEPCKTLTSSTLMVGNAMTLGNLNIPIKLCANVYSFISLLVVAVYT